MSKAHGYCKLTNTLSIFIFITKLLYISVMFNCCHLFCLLHFYLIRLVFLSTDTTLNPNVDHHRRCKYQQGIY
ncbi:hypothetical protein EB796_022854 [Bugula neritina]|uniref:Uncharacterized protein n=1 Tax=Bugula neritina TaxID=10212 RepID=A0A7J7J047_BUGNE|nr:hypothetical protein EB796_022854 [Bugula neritina]